ncbi:O-antigen ligase family protein [Thiocapsa rosea]|uniref:O-antigen ligase-related domain-containing protein n=1 Tax=Thiocapsa rosea TaxID=69360 RepID=A0A495VAC0_9GAMM|nr:O-antigen ligase family protein [Thiocapsa rosea]RKT45573.1 hypothetical protein BDD21_3037 [Thiocapsa rosea]
MLAAILILALFGVLMVSLKKPLLGLYVMLISLQIEYFFYGILPGGLTLGRLSGAIALLGWALNRNGLRRTLMANRRERTIVVPLAFFLFFTFAGTLMAEEPGTALSMWIRIVMLVAMSIMIIDLIRSRADMVALIWVISLGALIGSAVAVLQYVGFSQGGEVLGNIHQTREGVRFEGLTSNANVLGIHLLTALPFVMVGFFTSKAKSARIFFAITATLMAFVIVLTVSRSTIYPFLIFVLCYVVARQLMGFRSEGAYIGVGLLVGLLLVSVMMSDDYTRERIMRPIENYEEETSMKKRMEILFQGFDIVEISPLVGVGLGNTRNYLMGRDAHDTVSCLVGETGILGSISFLTFFVVLLVWQRSVWLRTRTFGDSLQKELVVAVVATGVVLILWFPVKILLYQRLFWLWVAMIVWMHTRLPYEGRNDPALNTSRNLNRVCDLSLPTHGLSRYQSKN